MAEAGGGDRAHGWRGLRVVRPGETLAPALTDDEADLRALLVRERAHTIRLAIVAATIVMALGILVPIANAAPGWRRRRL